MPYKSTNELPRCPMIPHSIPLFDHDHGDHLVVGTSNSSNVSQLDAPLDIFFDNKGNLYVADTGNNRILKYIQNMTDTILINEHSSLYPKLKRPTALFVDEYENIYVTDSQGEDNVPIRLYYRVLMYWPLSKDKYEVAELFTGSDSQCNDIYLDSDFNIYTAEMYNNRVMKWFAPYYNHSIILVDGNILGWGAYSDYFTPRSIYIDYNTNDLYILHYYPGFIDYKVFENYKNRIIVWSNNTQKNITLISEPVDPRIMAGDCNGNLYVLDIGIFRISAYQSISSVAKSSSVPVEFPSVYSYPFDVYSISSIALNPRNGNLYIINKRYNNIIKYTISCYFQRIPVV